MNDFLTVMLSVALLIALGFFLRANDQDGNSNPGNTMLGTKPHGFVDDSKGGRKARG